MTSRTLPREEWGRLTETDIPTVVPFVQPGEMEVIVVEDGDQIVGAWAIWRVVHLEGLWIAPAYRGKSSVARRLLAATLTAVRRWTPQWVMTMAATPEVKRLLTQHVGAVQVPGETFVFPIQESSRCQLD